MTLCKLEALDGARVVITENSGMNQMLVAWFGGTTFNVYTQTGDIEHPLDETAVFSISDENGEPLEPDTAEEKAREWLQETLEKQK